MKEEINRRLLENKSLWEEINQQTTLFLSLFTELSNQYNQERLTSIFPFAKGCKVTKGLQLEGYPYQVLDLIRDFDPDSGFNIRILNWWGHGLYLLVLGGRDFGGRLIEFNLSHTSSFSISQDFDVWNYKKILHPVREKNYTKVHESLQIFKKIELPDTATQLQVVLSKEIDRILEYPW
ncbi:hypothetical protein [Mongoliitalea daihaiensis]|uniref:hypothetical protein n=1 Tax=Mongoliitalea daihaiensis TaxID=2782006 RepID=UPI001F2FAE5D|nr:hypothetical protein [Mongoliitalea daihaiensis]UJP63264.1 hypothetical protein IPZ59_10390 [Mongoliitalea daihaiensis]